MNPLYTECVDAPGHTSARRVRKFYQLLIHEQCLTAKGRCFRTLGMSQGLLSWLERLNVRERKATGTIIVQSTAHFSKSSSTLVEKRGPRMEQEWGSLSLDLARGEPWSGSLLLRPPPLLCTLHTNLLAANDRECKGSCPVFSPLAQVHGEQGWVTCWVLNAVSPSVLH